MYYCKVFCCCCTEKYWWSRRSSHVLHSRGGGVSVWLDFLHPYTSLHTSHTQGSLTPPLNFTSHFSLSHFNFISLHYIHLLHLTSLCFMSVTYFTLLIHFSFIWLHFTSPLNPSLHVLTHLPHPRLPHFTCHSLISLLNPSLHLPTHPAHPHFTSQHTSSPHSLLSWNNETLNVWSHLLGFMVFLGLLVYDVMFVFHQYRGTRHDAVVVAFVLLSFMVRHCREHNT